jgi:hypothetical protein
MKASSNIRSHSTTGAEGGVFVNTTSAVKGSFYAVQVVEANTMLSVIGNLDNAGQLLSAALPTGFTIYGRFDSVSVLSGSAILYKV